MDTGSAGETTFETFLDELSTAFVRAQATEIDEGIEAWLQRLVEFFHADRSVLSELTDDGGLVITHTWARPGHALSFTELDIAQPWLAARLRRGEAFAMSSIDDLPAEAAIEREHVRRDRIKAHLSIPLMLSDVTIGSLGITRIRNGCEWPPAMQQRLRLIAKVFANALARRRVVLEYLQLARTMEHAGRVSTIGRLAVAFAHEIKQPLSASLTNAQTALRMLAAERPALDEVRAALEDIAIDNRRAGDIVNEWGRFLRRQEPEMQPLAVVPLLEAVARFVSPQARYQRVDVRIDAPGDLPAVLGDRVQLQQVFVNLMLNAFEALAGTPREQRRLVLTALPAPRNRVTFSVIDSGPGVPDDQVETLFEPFVSGKPDGLGIGLAIAQSIITAHGGRLAYAHAPQGGALFSFSLAAAGAAEPAGAR